MIVFTLIITANNIVIVQAWEWQEQNIYLGEDGKCKSCGWSGPKSSQSTDAAAGDGVDSKQIHIYHCHSLSF